MIAMAYAFAISYLNQYPAEAVGPSNFACDVTIRNAKFDSSLQALAVPISDEEQEIFDMLNDQNFTLEFGFINTVASCQKLSFSKVSGSSTTPLNFSSCSDQNGILSASVFLPDHGITVVATIDDIQLVGGVSVGLSGPGQENDSYTLQELGFIQSFYSQSALTFAQTATIDLALTKVSDYLNIVS
jgi:ribosomal protein S8